MSWIADVIAQGGLAGVAALTFIETFFPPIPSEVVMPLSGAAAAQGNFPIAGAVAAGIAGSMGGNIVFYLLARRLGVERFEDWVDRHGRWLTLDRTTVERARRWFEHAGPWVVGFGRCLPGVRSIVSIPAGLSGMAPLPFFLWSLAGTSVWTTTLTLAGYKLGKSSIPAVEALIGPLSNGIILVALGVYLFRLATWRRR